MKQVGFFVIAIGLTMAIGIAPALCDPAHPMPTDGANLRNNDSVLLAQRTGVVEDAVERKKTTEEDLWEAEEKLFDEEEEETLTIADPLYYVNKGIWHFNDVVNIYVAEPAARGYNRALPETMRRGVTNFFSNWYTPVRLVSCLLQAKWKEAGTESGRFLINTTFGVLGFADLAREEEWVGWEEADEDLGQVFGAWGVGHGFYLVLPMLGPSSARDGISRFGERYLDPLSYLDLHTWESVTISAYRGFAQYAPYAGEYIKLKEMALDPYTAMRNAYVQLRARKVRE